MNKTLHTRTLFDFLDMMNKTLLCIYLDDRTPQLYCGLYHNYLRTSNPYDSQYTNISLISNILMVFSYLSYNHDSKGISLDYVLEAH